MGETGLLRLEIGKLMKWKDRVWSGFQMLTKPHEGGSKIVGKAFSGEDMDCVWSLSGRCGCGNEMRRLCFYIHTRGSLNGSEPEQADRKKNQILHEPYDLRNSCQCCAIFCIVGADECDGCGKT